MVNKSERSLYEYGKQGPGQGPDGDGGWKESYCTICTTVKAPHECVKCKKKVCSEHFVSLMGLCVDCAPVKDTGKSFKMSEPMGGDRPETPPQEPTIQKIAEQKGGSTHGDSRVITFGVEEPQDVRRVVLPPKNAEKPPDQEKKGKNDEDVIIFQRNAPKKAKKKDDDGSGTEGEAGGDGDERTIDIEWV